MKRNGLINAADLVIAVGAPAQKLEPQVNLREGTETNRFFQISEFAARAARPRYELFLGSTLLREAEFQLSELLLELSRLVGIEVARYRPGPFLEGAFPFLCGQGILTHA